MEVLAQAGELVDAALQASDKGPSQFLNFVFAIFILAAFYFLKQSQDNQRDQTRLQERVWRGDPANKEDTGVLGWLGEMREDMKELKAEHRGHKVQNASEHQAIMHKLNGGPK